MSKTTTTNNATVNAKVDFFQSARTLSTRTSEFFRCVIKKAELNTIYGSKIDANNNSIAAIDDMLEKGSGNLDITVEDLNRMRTNYITINEGLKVEWDRLLKEQAYKLDVSGTTFETAVLESIGKKIDTKTIVKSNGTKALKYDVTNALKNLYGVGFEWMVEAGTIKPADIPSVLTDKYTKKSKKNNK